MLEPSTFAVAGLAIAFALGFYRVLRGPTSTDRLLSLLLIGTTSVAVLLVLAAGTDAPEGLLDAALALAILAPVTTLAFLLTDNAEGRRDGG